MRPGESAILVYFFFNDTATTEIYTLSLHDALPISMPRTRTTFCRPRSPRAMVTSRFGTPKRSARNATSARVAAPRSEEHTSELQSRQYLVCRLLLEKKKAHKN